LLDNIFLDKDSFVDRFDFYFRRSLPFIFLIDFSMKNFFIAPALELNNTKNILYDFNGFANAKYNNFKKITLTSFPITFEEYKKKFEIVYNHLLDGDSYLLNLTFPTNIKIDSTLEDIFYNSRASYKLKFYDSFVFFSPERFILIKDGKIYTHPMKGTRVIDDDNSETELMKDEKEIAEHLTIVDLMRNDLNMIAKNVKVNIFRYTSYIKTCKKTIIQTSSEIEGDLKGGSVAEKILRILPAGSISGAPKKKTLEIIDKAEVDKRGFYTGIAGFFDGKILDTSVIIRYIEKNGEQFIYRSGGGITVYSEVEKEYKEMIDKIYVPSF